MACTGQAEALRNRPKRCSLGTSQVCPPQPQRLPPAPGSPAADVYISNERTAIVKHATNVRLSRRWAAPGQSDPRLACTRRCPCNAEGLISSLPSTHSCWSLFYWLLHLPCPGCSCCTSGRRHPRRPCCTACLLSWQGEAGGTGLADQRSTSHWQHCGRAMPPQQPSGSRAHPLLQVFSADTLLQLQPAAAWTLPTAGSAPASSCSATVCCWRRAGTCRVRLGLPLQPDRTALQLCRAGHCQ